MNKITVLILLSVLSFGAAHAQEQTVKRHCFNFKNTDLITKDSATLNSADRTIILAETDSFVMFANYKIFSDTFRKLLPVNAGYKGINESFFSEVKKQQGTVIQVKSMQLSKEQQSVLLYNISNFMESGYALVYNKYSHQLARKLVLTRYYCNYDNGKSATEKEFHADKIRILLYENMWD